MHRRAMRWIISRPMTCIGSYPASPGCTVRCSRPGRGSRGRHARATIGEGWAMETSMAERLEQAVATLNDLIELTGNSGLRDTAQFLAMAKLHLLIEVNEVTDAEFRALCDALEGQAGRRPKGTRRAPPLRNRRDGELRAM